MENELKRCTSDRLAFNHVYDQLIAKTDSTAKRSKILSLNEVGQE